MEIPSNAVSITTTVRIDGIGNAPVDSNEFVTSIVVQDNRLDRVTALLETCWMATTRAVHRAIREKYQNPYGVYTSDEEASE